MPSATPRPSQLLHYLPAHRVLICKECHYAIQPSAVSRHLKELHRIYRSHRQEFMEYTQSLDLADPGDVVLPEPHEAPVPFLPANSGLACGAPGCGHLCITVKRMKSHWATVHSDMAAEAAQWRPVELQTFFRGNQLRYFIVSRNGMPTPQPERNSALDGEASNLEVDPPEAPSTSNSDWSADDLDLLEHFKSSTYLELGNGSESRKVWQTAVPELVYSHSFLKHGLLACSALHLAYLNPSERQRYQLTAARHQDRALPSFRFAIANASATNCNALLAFSQLLVIHCFASEYQDENLFLVKGKHESTLPDWLQVIRGSCTLFKNLKQFITNGPLTPILAEAMASERFPPALEISEQARRIGLLRKIAFFGENSMAQQMIKGSLSSFPGAHLELSRAFSKAETALSHSVYTMWTAVYIWPAQVSEGYLDLLKDRDPAALILLAHYCILLGPLESHWYMTGYRKRLLSQIYAQLDEEWRQWLQWPLEEIGLQL